MALRVAFDANVLVSAYGFGGKPAELMRAALLGEFSGIVVVPHADALARIAS